MRLSGDIGNIYSHIYIYTNLHMPIYTDTKYKIDREIDL